MANNDIEIEIQVNIKNTNPLLDFLKENARFKGEKRQIDQYFTPAHKDFISTRPVNEWLRLRDSSGKYSINYKNWKRDENGKSLYCDEFETPIEDIEKLRKIFQALGFKLLAEVDKTRQLWDYQDYEIAIDSVKGLGDFVEIEYKGKDLTVDPKKVTDEMIQFLKDLGCKNITRNYQGYPFLLMFPKEAEYETV